MKDSKILITGDFNIPSQYLASNVIHLRVPIDNDHIIKNLLGVRYYIIGGPEYVNDYIMSQAPNLEYVIVMGTGTNSFIDLEAALTRQIKVDNLPTINSDAVAEFALGAVIFNLANSFHSREELLKGNWYQKTHMTLPETKIGIIGMGDIGTKLVSKIRSLSKHTELSYFSRTRKLGFEKEFDLRFKNLNGIVRECDALILCVAYNEDSHQMINAKVLHSAKNGLMIFNFSNPRVIDHNALHDNILSGVVGFTYFDGYYDEWAMNKGQALDQYGLLNLGANKFIATSHIAAQANNAIFEMIEMAFKKITHWELCFNKSQKE